jgi:hypothetical protein
MMSTGIAVRVADDPDFRSLGLATAILGGTATTVLAVYDIATASRAARETRRASGFALLPTDLRDVARCGPFPCAARISGTHNPFRHAHSRSQPEESFPRLPR